MVGYGRMNCRIWQDNGRIICRMQDELQDELQDNLQDAGWIAG
jgi:hypothetical protein